MTNFDSTLHPRGNENNAGQFRAITHTPGNDLEIVPDNPDALALLGGDLDSADEAAAARRLIEAALSEEVPADQVTVRVLLEDDKLLEEAITELAYSHGEQPVDPQHAGVELLENLLQGGREKKELDALSTPAKLDDYEDVQAYISGLALQRDSIEDLQGQAQAKALSMDMKDAFPSADRFTIREATAEDDLAVIVVDKDGYAVKAATEHFTMGARKGHYSELDGISGQTFAVEQQSQWRPGDIMDPVPAPEPIMPVKRSEKNPQWDEVTGHMMAHGASEPQARALTAAQVALTFTQQLQDASRDAISRGGTSHAVMTTTGLSAMQRTIEPISKADEDPERAREALAKARASIRSSNSLFGSFHPSGKEPVLADVDRMLGDIEDYLAA